MSKRIGVIHGRFQGLHIGHMEYLLEGKKRCDFLYIGITNPDASFIVKNDTDGLRSTELANPFTYFERLEMVRDAMLEYGIPREEFEIVPFPIHHPNLLHFYTPLDATYFLTIYDNRGTYKYEEFKKLKLKIDVMREKDFSEKTCSGTRVREMMANNEDFSNFVPKSTYTYIKEHGLDKRVKQLAKKYS